MHTKQNLDFDPHTAKAEDFLPLLNMFSSRFGKVPNIGVYAQITGIEHESKVILQDCETYVSMDSATIEVAGSPYKAVGSNRDPWQFSFKSLFNLK